MLRGPEPLGSSGSCAWLHPAHTTRLGHFLTREQSLFLSEQVKRSPQAELRGGMQSLVARLAPSLCRELKPGVWFAQAAFLPG